MRAAPLSELELFSRTEIEADAIREDVHEAFAGIDPALWDALRGTYVAEQLLWDVRATNNPARLAAKIDELKRNNTQTRINLRSSVTDQFLKPLGWIRSQRRSRGELFGHGCFNGGATWDHPEGFSVKGSRALKAVMVHNYWCYEPTLFGSMNDNNDKVRSCGLTGNNARIAAKYGFYGNIGYSREAARRASEALVIRLPESWYFPGQTTAFLIVRVGW